MGYFTERRFERRFKPKNKIEIPMHEKSTLKVSLDKPNRRKRNEKQLKGGMRNDGSN